MSRVRVKICGITSIQDLHAAVEAGADAVGFVVETPQSPRTLSIKEAKQLIRETPIFVETVAVTVPEDLSHLEKVYEELSPDIIQVHDSSHLYEKIRKRLHDARVIGAVQARPDIDIDSILKVAAGFDAILLDSYVPGKLGGSGEPHDWKISKRIRDLIDPKPLILAGGLRPENVKEAIHTVKPYAVDVSSGVEKKPGVKDREKIFQFVKNAREAEI
ncbi:MAG: phosphoribosylanthranilate isomerase [Nitrososphaerota archaeon]